MDRRDFLRLAGGTALLYGTPFLSSCSKTARNQSAAEILTEVRKIQSSLSAFPKNPVAVAYDAGVNYYPRLRDVSGWFRDKSNVYPLVEKAIMLMNRDNPENPFSKIVKPGDTVVIKPNWGT